MQEAGHDASNAGCSVSVATLIGPKKNENERCTQVECTQVECTQVGVYPGGGVPR